jgi:hypothetical protein
LGQVTDGGPFIADDFTAVRFILFEDEGEEGGFACAVGSYEGDTLSVVDSHAGFLEEDTGVEGFGNVFEG